MLKELCFEIIQKCTNNCQFCSSCSSMKEENIIEFELFKEVIEHIMRNGGLREISISGGEPFLHKDLFKMVELCKSYGIKTSVYTSGIVENYIRNTVTDYTGYSDIEKSILEKVKELDFLFIDKEKLLKLKQLGLDKLVLDLQTLDQDRYNELMGTKNNFSAALHSMMNAKSAGLYTEVHFIPMKSNYNDIEDILEMCDIAEVNKLSILKFVPQGRGRVNRDRLALNNDELKEFCQRIEGLRKYFKVKIRLGIPLTERDEHLCTAGYDKLSIRYDGVVLPCVAFKEIDAKELETVLARNGHPFKSFSIKERLDMIVPVLGSNRTPICKQVYEKI